MIKFAELDENNNIVNVVLATESSILQIPGIFVKEDGSNGEAVIGGMYNKENNKFIFSKPFPSWVLDENLDWQSPIGPKPEDDKRYTWDEENQSWVEISIVDISL